MTESEIVIAGCGNPLYADDGFGPAVIEELQKSPLPEYVKVIDAGICGPALVFPFLDPVVTRKLIIVDSMDFGGRPGSVRCLCIKDLGIDTIRDSSPGGIAESIRNLWGRITITIVGCQPKDVPYPEMRIGLSNEVQEAVSYAVHVLLENLWRDYKMRNLHLSGRTAGTNEAAFPILKGR
ncbi:MAG: coenzyme F420-reducing hydrogenase, FrhD protein [Methanoregulaceae archaeon]|jgi:coenzyme F420 hydrogenase subunit delta